jgi:hypothetical protein
MVLTQKQTGRPMHQMEEPDISPCIYNQQIFEKGVQNTQWRKTASSTNAAGETGYSHVED